MIFKSKRKWIQWIGKAIIAGVISLMILSVYVFCFNYSGVHVKNSSNATDYKWEAFQRKAVSNEGYAWNSMDEEGFNNYLIPATVDILLMGSSHMEAVNIERNENAGYLLNKMLTDKNLYNIGMSGHTIYTCVQNMKDAISYYSPSDYVILETSDIFLDEEGMICVLNNEYPKIKSYDSGIIYMLQKKLPVVKVVYKAIDDWRSSDIRSVVVEAEDKTHYIDSNYSMMLNQFLNKAVSDATASGAKLIIFYHPTTEIDEKGDIISITDPAALAAFQEACDNNDIIFVDMTSDFEELYKEEHILAHGFINTSVGTGHLNKYGHKVIAERLTKVIGGEN